MKTTIDLPKRLAIRLKITAARQGKRVKAVATETFRTALVGPAPRRAPGHRVKLPLIVALPEMHVVGPGNRVAVFGGHGPGGKIGTR